MESNSFSKATLRMRHLATLALPLLLSALAPTLNAQGPKLVVAEPAPVTVSRGGTAELKLTATLNPGFHANSHTPSDENLIPLNLEWQPGAVTARQVIYPKPQMEKYEFSDKPLSVVTGSFVLTTQFAAPSSTPAGQSVMTGKLRYQACSNNACFPPKTVEVKVPVSVK